MTQPQRRQKMSTQKSGLGVFGFSIIGALCGFLIIIISNAAGKIILEMNNALPIAEAIITAKFTFNIVYVILVGVPMAYLALKKESWCFWFHIFFFICMPTSILTSNKFFTPLTRWLLLWILASMAAYHIAVICSRYRRGK